MRVWKDLTVRRHGYAWLVTPGDRPTFRVVPDDHRAMVGPCGIDAETDHRGPDRLYRDDRRFGSLGDVCDALASHYGLEEITDRAMREALS